MLIQGEASRGVGAVAGVVPPGGPGAVAILVPDLDALGGMERQAAALAPRLVARGRPVAVFTCPSPGARRLLVPRREDRGDVPVVWLPRRLFEPLLPLLLEAGRYEWLYAVGLMMGAIGARVGPIVGAPLAVQLPCGGPYGDMADLARLCPADRSAVARDLSRATLVAISAEIRAEVLAAGFRPEQVVTIPNGVDCAGVAAAPPVQPCGPGVRTVLFAGRLHPQKGLEVLLDAFARVTAGTPDVRLVLAGEGPLRQELERQRDALGLSGRLVLLGRRDDVWGLLRGATVSVLPSRAEGVSVALLEALAAGCPTVASRIAPNEEVLAPPEGAAAGVLVEPGDAEALAEALQRLLRDQAARAALADAGRARVRAAYSLDAVAAAYDALFERRGDRRRARLIRFSARYARARLADLERVARRWSGGNR